MVEIGVDDPRLFDTFRTTGRFDGESFVLPPGSRSYTLASKFVDSVTPNSGLQKVEQACVLSVGDRGLDAELTELDNLLGNLSFDRNRGMMSYSDARNPKFPLVKLLCDDVQLFPNEGNRPMEIKAGDHLIICDIDGSAAMVVGYEGDRRFKIIRNNALVLIDGGGRMEKRYVYA